MSSGPVVERVKPVSIISIILLLTVIALFAFISYSIFFPKTVSFNVRPAGASVYSNGESVCASTPCRVSMNRILPRHIVIHRAKHFPHNINLPAFGVGWDDHLDGVIELKSMVIEKDKEAGLKACREKRVKVSDPNNVDAEPCYRVPPVMPWQAKRSGHCHLIFDIHDTGATKNIRLNGCTERGFESAAVEAVEAWTYLPKIENGEAVERLGVQNKISFRLTDEAGRIIPELSYYKDNPEHEHNVSVQ